MSEEKKNEDSGEQKSATTSSNPEISGSTTSDTEKAHDVELNKSSATDNENPPDPNEVDWDGPDDPHNPRNWSAWRRGMLVGVITSVVFSTNLAASAIAPAIPQVLEEFGSHNQELGTLAITIELLGTGVGPIIMGPMSEIVGRRIIYNCANIGFSAFSIGCALTPSLSGLIILRFLQGCAASSSLNNAGGTISDLVPIHRRGLAMSMYSAGFLLGPVIGPIAGSFLAAAKGWRWIFWLLLIVNGSVGLICALTYPETYGPVILQRKVNKLRKETGSSELYAKGQRQLPASAILKRAISRPVKMFLFCPVVTGLAIYNGVVYGFTYLLFSTFAAVFGDHYHFSDGKVGISYIGLALGFLISLSIASIANDRTHARLTKKHGVAKPEYRLESLIYGAIAIPVGFFIYGWTAKYFVNSAVPIVATGIVGFGVMFTFIPFNVYMIDAYTKYAASAIAAGNILRSISAALLPLAGAPLYDRLGYGWGNSLLAFIALGLGGMCVLFRRYGEEWRRRFPVELD